MDWLLWSCANLLPNDPVGWFYFWAFVGSLGGTAARGFLNR